MSPVRMGVLISVALAAAIGFALVARGLTAAREPRTVTVAAAPAPPPNPMVRVLVARRDLQPGDKLTQGDFTWQPWPKADVNAAYVTDGPADAPAPAKAPATVKIQTAAVTAADKTRDMIAGPGPAARMVDAIVHDPILQGEPITDRKVVRSGAAGVLAATLDPGLRAMAVPLSAESAAGGFILPGDHVDVVQSRQIDSLGGEKKFASGTVLKNVKVLAIDQNTHSQRQTTALGVTATLEVTPDQAELLALSKSQGELTLILRSYADMAGGASAGAGLLPGGRNQAMAAPNVVKVFRNGMVSDVTVSQ